MTTAIIVQARMTSKRFPGKVLAPLAGVPVLQRVLERCALVPFIDTIICAFPADDASVPIYELCNSLGVSCASGSENDVLSRYYDAADMYGIDTIMRITADCPFFDPVVAGEVLALLKASELDYCSNVFPIRTYPKGFDVEVFTFDCLEAAWATTKSLENREHVTKWMQHRKGIRRANVRQKIDRSGLNFCVDYPEDIKRLEGLLAKVKLPGLGLNATGTLPAVEKVSQWTKQLMELMTDGKPN
jgi:spore coat polysaccharide biosynthesis protein SpsF (cytidylyltransferase family)